MHQQIQGYKINVISSEIMFAYSYSQGEGPELNLLHHNNHFMVITTLPGFFEWSFYCSVCKKGYTRKRSHVMCGHRYIGRQGCYQRDIFRMNMNIKLINIAGASAVLRWAHVSDSSGCSVTSVIVGSPVRSVSTSIK
jgi:hypothetical protein